jgi:ribose transport system permease protein
MYKLRNRIMQLFYRHTTLAVFLLLFVIFGLFSSSFFQYQNLENIVKQASYIGIVAAGMTVVLLTAGIDLSVGSNMYLSASVAGLLILHYHVPVWLALVICLCVGTLFGIINAFAITRLKIMPFVVTLGTMVAGRGVALLITKSQAVPFPDEIIRIGSIRIFNLIPLPIFLFACVIIGVYIFLMYTVTGRQIYAVGNNPENAKKAGIIVDRVLAVPYIICGFLAALGGFISVAQLGIVNAGFGKGDEFDAIAAAVLGGTSLFGGVGNVFPGTLIGAVLIRMVSSGLVSLQIDLYLQPLISAGIIFIAVFLDSLKNRQLKKLGRRRIRVQRDSESLKL